MKNESCIWLSPEDRVLLEGWVAGRNTPQKLVWRARIVLTLAQGAGVAATLRATGKTKRTVNRWRERYLASGAVGLEPRRHPSRPQAAFERGDNRAAQREAGGEHPLVAAQNVQGGRPEPFEHAAHLSGAWAQAASDAQLQAVQRSQVL